MPKTLTDFLSSLTPATAIPHITNDFHTLDHIGWYGSAYLLSMMSFQPLFGRVYVYFEAKTMYLISLLIFEIGSVICASAPVSFALVFGRAVAGCGAAGMVTGSLAIFGRVVPLRKRPWGMSMMTSIYSLATMFGLTVGGVITDSHLTWRFCFWINLRMFGQPLGKFYSWAGNSNSLTYCSQPSDLQQRLL